MRASKESLLKRLGEIKQMGEAALRTERGDGYFRYLDQGASRGFRVAGLSYIETVFGAAHSHYTEFRKSVNGNQIGDVTQGLAILDVVRVELEQGWLASVSALVAADLFGDFLEMATYLVSEGYKDAAAVMAGGVLEGHLRRLCTNRGIAVHVDKNGTPSPKKADQMNSDLAREKAYVTTDQKLVTGWLGLRNDAAHGHYDRYRSEQVENMIQGIMFFMSKVDA